MNPLDLPGPEFLKLYTFLLVAALLLSVLVKWRIKKSSCAIARPNDDLDPFEIAYLAGGRLRAIQSAIVSLVARERIKLAAAGTVRQTNPIEDSAYPFEKAVYRAVGIGGDRQARDLPTACQPAVDQMDDSLVAAGLAVPSGSRVAGQILAASVMLPVLLLGIAKIAVGASRGRPVGFLVMLVIATIIALIATLGWSIRRTRAGDAVLREWKNSRDDLKSATRKTSNDDLLLAVALFGVPLLANTGHEALLSRLQQERMARDSSSFGGSSCGSGCGSSCGGGGCGGGCGGCGGCGG